MIEEWRDCLGYEGFYQASTLGRIRSLSRKVRTGYGSAAFKAGRVLKPDRFGRYERVHLSVDGVSRRELVHRLVAGAFHPNPGAARTVNHKDGDRLNNRPENLEWATHRENIIHRFAVLRSGLKPITAIRENSPVGHWFPSQVDACSELGLTPCVVSHVLKGRQKRTGGYHLQYCGVGAIL